MVALTDFETGFNQEWYIPYALLTGIGLFIMLLSGAPLRETLIFLLMFLFANIVLLFAYSQQPENRFLQIFSDTRFDMSIAFYIGVLLWGGLRTLGNTEFLGSILSVVTKMPTISLLSVTETSLTPAQYNFINGVVAPFVEEIFFPFALGAMIFFIVQRSLENDLISYIISAAAVGVAFAGFHTSQPVFSSFWIAALMFSLVIRGIGYLDEAVNIIPFYAVNLGFFVGAHTINNILELGGLTEFFTVLSGDTVLFGLTVFTYGIFALWAVQGIQENMLGGG